MEDSKNKSVLGLFSNTERKYFPWRVSYHSCDSWYMFRRPGWSQGLLYKHRHSLLILWFFPLLCVCFYPLWYRCYYPQTSRDSGSPLCRIFFFFLSCGYFNQTKKTQTITFTTFIISILIRLSTWYSFLHKSNLERVYI